MRGIVATMVVVLLGVATLWAGAVPATLETDAGFGGCEHCSGTKTDSCYDANSNCGGTYLHCVHDDGGTGDCVHLDTDPCEHPPGVSCPHDIDCIF